MTSSDLADAVRSTLATGGDPERAAAQQRYMKSEMPYRGFRLPELRKAIKPLLAEYPPEDRASWEATIRTLWDEAAYREERYAAIAIARHRTARPWLDPGAVPLFRHLVVTGAWWDLVDEVASHLVGDTLLAHRPEVTPVLRDWARDDDLWIRRAAVICQIRARGETDLDLLRYAIESNVDDPTFWLRKAIGWALRSYGSTDPGWVRAEVERYGDRLSGLSRREAMKHL